jgi:spore coat polysaccharide biosynthesis protein SpsF (cytidylyltransferase family)/spore coat polysaccharide biosynthesis predicted glycosyltransferase SpsG
MAQKVAAVIGARLNSSRLPGKQLLPLAGKPLITHIVERLRRVKGLDQIMLATTADDFNKPLRDWAAENGVECLAYEGDVNDLVGRVDTAFSQTGADQLLYICGDCPLIEPSTLERMIEAMRATPRAGLAKLRPAADGKRFIHEGFDLYARDFWQAMVEVAHKPFEREHIGAVYHHLGKVTPEAIAWVDEPAHFAAVDHRISVDTPSDYRFMRRIYADWFASRDAHEIVDLSHVIARLENEPDLAAMNHHVHQKQVGENSKSVLVVTEAGPKAGMGHLSRSLVLAAALQDYVGAKVQLLIIGPQVEREELALIPHEWLDEANVQAELAGRTADLLVVDVQRVTGGLRAYLAGSAIHPAIGIDVGEADEDFFDHVWVPSFYMAPERAGRLNGRLSYGWDHYLLGATPGQAPGEGKKLIVLTGGGDVAALGNVWPRLLDQALRADVQVDWVQGPYANEPDVGGIEERLNVLKSPGDLSSRIAGYHAALSVFGVSFFECLQADVPVVTCDPVGVSNPQEWESLKTALPGQVADCAEEAVGLLAGLMEGRTELHSHELATQMREGPRKFAALAADLLAGGEPKHV